MRNYLRDTSLTPALRAELMEDCKGKGGDPDAETVLNYTKRSHTHVDFYSCRGSDVCRVLRRAGSAVESFTKRDEGVSLKVRIRTEDGRKVFRGFEFSFAPIDVESQPMPATLKAGT